MRGNPRHSLDTNLDMKLIVLSLSVVLFVISPAAGIAEAAVLEYILASFRFAASETAGAEDRDAQDVSGRHDLPGQIRPSRRYAVQIGEYLPTRRDEIEILVNRLTREGHIVWTRETESLGDARIQVLVGVLESRTAAELLGDRLASMGITEYSIRECAPLIVPSPNGNNEVISLPSGLWLHDKITGASQNIIPLTQEEIEERSLNVADIHLDWSPTNEQFVFHYRTERGGLTYIYDCSKRLLSQLVPWTNSFPKFSSDGQYIVFLRYAFEPGQFEGPTDLCLMFSSQMGYYEKLTNYDYDGGQYGVSWYSWYPERDWVFYVEKFAYGTVSVGGNLYILDVESRKRKRVLSADYERGVDVHSATVVGERLVCRMNEYDENYEQIGFSEKVLNLREVENDFVEWIETSDLPR